MQAIIMAAGKGSRLGDITDNKPKSLLKIKGRSLLDINLSMLHKYDITNIIVVTGYMDREIAKAVEGITGIKLVYNPFYEFTNVIGSYFMGMNHIHEDFIYMHADTICDIGIFEDLLSADGDMVLPIDHKPCDEEAMKVRLKDDHIEEITKLMPVSDAAGEFIGIMKIKKEVISDLNACAEDVLRDRDFASYFEGAIQRVIDMHKYDIRTINTNGRFWSEVDFLEDYQRAERQITEDLLRNK